MHLSHAFQEKPVRQRRQFPRYGLQCRAHIQIGKRQYSGYIHNVSQKGAKLRTISPIGDPGQVILRLPDLPPLRCQLRWTELHYAGVVFCRELTEIELRRWVKSRSAVEELNQGPEVEYAEFVEVAANEAV